MPTNHVTSLELSRRLKELGVPQNSIYYWCQQEGQKPAVIPKARAKRILSWHKEIISAYLASELGEFIGNSLENGEDKNIPKELQTTSIQDIWKPDYLAKLLIWLLENHLISVEELGK